MKRSFWRTYLAVALRVASLLISGAILLCVFPVIFPFVVWDLYERSRKPVPKVRCFPCDADCNVTSLGFGVWIASCEHCGCTYTQPRPSNEEAGRRIFGRMKTVFSKVCRFRGSPATKTAPQQPEVRID